MGRQSRAGFRGPGLGPNCTTSKYIGQAKARYRHGLKFRGSIKYRYEKTTDPFVTGRGLFETRGREVLQPTSPSWAFYYQREDLRVQQATTLPTDYHAVELASSIKPHDKVNLSLRLRTTYDENNDLDSLDVQHFAIQPNLGFVLTPGERLWFSGGYTFNHSKSRGPITIPVFDG